MMFYLDNVEINCLIICWLFINIHIRTTFFTTWHWAHWSISSFIVLFLFSLKTGDFDPLLLYDLNLPRYINKMVVLKYLYYNQIIGGSFNYKFSLLFDNKWDLLLPIRMSLDLSFLVTSFYFLFSYFPSSMDQRK